MQDMKKIIIMIDKKRFSHIFS